MSQPQHTEPVKQEPVPQPEIKPVEPPKPVKEFEGKNVLVLGLGLSGGGVGVVKFLANHGAKITVSDEKRRKDLKPALDQLEGIKARYLFGKPRLDLLKKTDLIIVNPAVDLRSKFIAAAKKKRVPMDSELGLFVRRTKGIITAVSGTKGKSTVTKLIADILVRGGRRAFLGGNIGGSLLGRLPEIGERDHVVLEVSSFQLDLFRLAELQFHPRVAVLTNVLKDHLDRYDSVGAYERSKWSLFANQTREDAAIIRDDLKKKVKGLRARKIFFSGTLPKYISKNDITLKGPHNLENVAAAAKAAEALRVRSEMIRAGIREFHPLEHRLEFVTNLRGAQFYNDSASTTPDSTVKALESFARPAVLIAGGMNKGLPFTELGRSAAKKAKAVFLIGKSARDIKKAIAKVDRKKEVVIMPSLAAAVKAAFKSATIGDAVLFSPACASFDMFTNAKERGKEFKRLVENLRK